MKKYLPYILYAIIVGLLMRPFFEPGLLILLDMPWTPYIQLSDYLSGGIGSGFPLTLLFKFFSFFLPVSVIQKVLFGLIFFLSGAFMYRFARINRLGKEWAFAAGLFYMINPWMYERFLAGHWMVMLGYAFFPLAAVLFIELLKRPDRGAIMKLSILLSVYPILSMHWAYITYLFLGFSGLVYLWRKKQWKFLINPVFIKRIFFMFLGIVAVNSFWLFSFWGERSVWPKITLNDFKTFTTGADPVFGSFFNVLSLYGYWQDIYFLPKDFFTMWWLVSAAVIFLSAYGLFKLLKEKKIFGFITVFAFLPILFLAVGFANAITQKITEMVFYALPGFKGLRETAKLGGVIAFFLSFLYVIGIRGLARLTAVDLKPIQQKIIKNIALACAVILPFLMTFGIFSAFNDQVKTYEYPEGWQRVEEILSQDSRVGNVLFLPWHGYPNLDFAGNKKIANPAKNYFSFPITQGKNLNNIFLMETEQGEWGEYMTSIVQGVEDIDDNPEFLRKHNISNIILAKIHDFKRYEFLGNNESLHSVYEDNDIILYEVRF